MWAGSRFRFTGDLRIGDAARKRSTIGKIAHKAGRSGDLVFVTVNHDLFVGDRQVLAEEHDIVYREDPRPDAPQPVLQPAPEGDDFSRQITPDPVLLFRYSALTFNGHRIHYDQPYATQVEGYQGLVVHGPLTATLLLDTLRDNCAARVAEYSFRALATISDDMIFSTHGAWQDDGSVRLWARRPDGALAMDAIARLS
ncbi:acyl-CoA dehydrogenase [Paracoccus sp. (in: a-proteobacteria)]|uniref:acyl-CoA dehydrogenase n=1 Tax=Paracoccus sp. TaxID=267 RepID=UPI0026E095DA|nr:acyl-CoA dehydrogenase [Paracoccus sp. (in: a-proteobacteria)]